MNKYCLAFLLALVVVLASVTLRKSFASVTGDSKTSWASTSIGGSPMPPIPNATSIGGSPMPPIPHATGIGGGPPPPLSPPATDLGAPPPPLSPPAREGGGPPMVGVARPPGAG